ncbi:ArnT family glycosyltransferase [Legionella nautarum]|uniref:ArnT family glycosyltransferase n=1 Tax=Legionella nautarum TaxID=45070 RepID=UPI001EE6B3F4|nr:glycosyltransferase family 39 protein [Legionella nautarum]
MNKHSIEEQDWLKQPALVLFLFAILVLLLRIFLRGQLLEIDEAEQIVMAQRLSLGYPDQPPLYSWLQYFIFQLFGRHLVSLAVLKSLLLFACLYSFHQICRLYCQSRSLAWCATLSWVFIPSISLDLIKDNTHSVLALFAACVSWYWFVAPSRLKKTAWYAIFGLFIGIGLLSKFNYLIFLGLLFASAISLSTYRAKLFNWHLLITLFIAAIIASPYFFWLSHYPNLAFRSAYKLTNETRQIHGFIDLIKGCLIFVVPNIIISGLFFSNWRNSAPINPLNSLLSRYHFMSIPLLIALVFFGGLSNFETRWLIPILFLSPLLMFNRVKLLGELKPRVSYFLILALVTQCLFFIILIYRGHNEQRIQQRLLLNQMMQAIKTTARPTEYLVADSLWLLGNFMLLRPEESGWLLHPSTYPRLPRGHSLLIWHTAERPIWVDFFAGMQPEVSGITLIKDSQSQKVVAGYAYSAVK